MTRPRGGAERAAQPASAAAPAEPVGVGALGRVEPASRIRKLNQPGGFAISRVERLLVAEGDRMEAGQLLAVFSDAAQKDAAVAQAEAVLETLSSPRPEDLALAEAGLAAAEAQLARARADAALARVAAPIAGTVLRIYARPGDQVGSDGLMDLADLGRMDVVADVYETDLPRLHPGAAAEVIVPGEPRRYAATLREIGWLVRRTTQAGTDPVAAVDARTVEVRLTLSEEARAVLERRTNMQVQVAIRP